MKDLYKILGVKKSATSAEIHLAYRKHAKTAHPDAGGTPADWELLRVAYRTLCNPDARAFYDQTGQVKEFNDPADLRRSAVLAILAQMLDDLVTSAMEQNVDLLTQDAIKALCDVFSHRLSQIGERRAAALKRKAVYERIQARFHARPGENNILEDLVIGRLSTLDSELATHASQETLHKEALEIVRSHSFQMEAARQIQRYAYLQGIGTSTTSM